MSTATSPMGENKTGIKRSAKQAQRMISASEQLESEPAEADLAQQVRENYARDADPIGTLPPRATGELLGKAQEQQRKDHSSNLFMDKLGERLAFERTSVRLYQALIGKLDAYGTFSGGPSADELERLLEEELLHFQELEEAIAELGGDPTAVTPAADLIATVSKGVCDVLGDPRTTLAQCLEAMLVAELADNDAWEALTELAENAGEDKLAATFEQALTEEHEHLVLLRRWVAAAQGR